MPQSPPLSRRARLGAFWTRHRSLFWGLHSLWALATGVVVIMLARERYGFVPWVCLFLVLTWVSTLFFSRRPQSKGPVEEDAPAAPGLGEEASGYLLRTMYQETLFFLLPFYAYSTVIGSVNIIFPILLAGLAIVSCIDLVFDRWMRTMPIFGLVFFSAVSFAALNLLLPILTPLDPALGTSVAAVAAVASAVPLARSEPGHDRNDRRKVVGVSLAILLIPLLLPQLIPPVPLRLQETVFSSGIDQSTLMPADTLSGTVDAAQLNGVLVVLMEVFAPTMTATGVTLQWSLNGAPVRTSREIEITAHEEGFRVWDSWRPETGGVPPGEYQVVLSSDRGRVFGKAKVRVGG